MEPPPAKKPRPLAKSWKLFHLTNLNARNGKTFGLQDLFAHGFDSSAGPGAARTNSTDPRAGGFYTLRLEHRQGGPAAQFQGEERILLFADARSVGKIIFSSQLPESSATNRKPSLVDAADNAGLNAEKETHPIHYLTAHAKIHVLEVKSQLRGRDLGGLLFSAAITSLKSKYCIEDDCDVEREEKREGKMSSEPIESIGCKQLYDVQCILDAEEDVTRHGKLVSFYENLGCRVKPSKRVQYINNNDSETYRKVPMQIDLHPPAKANSLSKQERDRMRRRRFTNMVASKGSFLPVQLVGPLGKLSVCSYASEELIKLNWLIKEAPEGIQFCTTHGHLLVASPSGSVSVLSPDEEDNDNDSDLDIDTCVLNKWTYFVPCHISDTDDNAEGDGCSQSSDSSNSLWVLRTFFGHFLTADSIKQTLSCTRLPSFWQANGESLSLVCTTDTPARRHHYRKSWVQTYDYVNKMRSRFLSFSLGKATLFEALGWMSAFPAYPFNAWCSNEHIPGSNSPSPSLRTLCFLMAEAAREEGLPDWVQLVALFHELGESVKILDPSSTGEMAESIYDWTISSRSRGKSFWYMQCRSI